MLKILIVDDSSFSRKILSNIIKPLNCTILEANDGISALEQFVLYHPDIVFLDMTMIGMSGLEVLDTFQKINANIPIIVASADGQRTTKEEVSSRGAADFIEKPFTTDSVLNIVHAYLTNPKQ